MENNDFTKIDIYEFESRIDSMTTKEELIESHKGLVGKSCERDYYVNKDYGIIFIDRFLSRDRGRSIVYHYSKGAKEFINSKYLSDYFKTIIREFLSSEKISDEVLNTINSDKLINDMSEEELSGIYSSIKNMNGKSNNEIEYMADLLLSLLFKLNGKGVMSFIKNNLNNEDLASRILLTSGMMNRGSFYSGRGVNLGDLNEENLIEIFIKLLKIDQNYASEFVEMVKQMKTLGATEFVNTFMNFANNGFKSNNLEIDDNNVSLDGLYDSARNIAALASIISMMSRGDDMNYQIKTSERIKQYFIMGIKPILIKINPEFTYDYNQHNINIKKR